MPLNLDVPLVARGRHEQKWNCSHLYAPYKACCVAEAALEFLLLVRRASRAAIKLTQRYQRSRMLTLFETAAGAGMPACM
jgi:hypothetical protein